MAEKASECVWCSCKRLGIITRVYFGVSACLPGARIVAVTSAAPAASELLVAPLPSAVTKSPDGSRESRPVFKNTSVHHDLCFSSRLCVDSVQPSREYFSHVSSLHLFCSLVPTSESLNQHSSVVTEKKRKKKSATKGNNWRGKSEASVNLYLRRQQKKDSLSDSGTELNSLNSSDSG